jgi:hypothetical protein
LGRIPAFITDPGGKTRIDCEVRGHCMCKKMPVIPVNRVVNKKILIGKKSGPSMRRGTRGC